MNQKIHDSLFVITPSGEGSSCKRDPQRDGGTKGLIPFILHSPTKRGFSLLEMVVAIGIFAMVVVGATRIVISASEAQLKASQLRIVQDNIRFAMEYMTKEIRTGTAVTDLSCGGGLCSRIRFVNDRGCTIEYRRQNSILQRLISGTCTAATIDMTSDDISVDNLQFFVRGNNPGPSDGQTTTTVVMQVSSVPGKVKVQTAMNLQTTVTQRLREMQ